MEIKRTIESIEKVKNIKREYNILFRKKLLHRATKILLMPIVRQGKVKGNSAKQMQNVRLTAVLMPIVNKIMVKYLTFLEKLCYNN